MNLFCLCQQDSRIPIILMDQTEFRENWNSNLKRNLPGMAQDVASKTAMKPTDSISWIFSKLQMSIMNQGPNRKSWKSAAKYQLSPMQEGLKWEIR